MVKPISLRVEDTDPFKHVRPVVHLVRAATAHLRAYVKKSTPEYVVAELWGRDPVTVEVLRAATAPATTTTTGWAKELARVATYDLVQSVTSVSAGAELIDRGLQLSLDGIAELRIPGRVLNAAAAGQWVAEGAPAPARQLSFANAILQPRKLSVLMAFTHEQAESSNIEAIVRQTMGEAAGLALDAAMFSAVAGDASRPPGLFVGVAPIGAATGGGTNAMMTDLGKLFGALANAGAGKNAVIVAATAEAMTLKATLGPKWDYDIIPSATFAPGTVAVVETASFVSGFSPTPTFRVADQASYHAEDTSPQDITGGTPSPAVPVKSMFQTNSVALKMDFHAAWGLRAAGHAQYLTGATW
jgi:hypothetical protein